MVLSKLERRAMKEVLIAQYTLRPEEMTYATCIVRKSEFKTLEERTEQSLQLYKSPELLWPFDNTHLIAIQSHSAEETDKELGAAHLVGKARSATALLYSWSSKRVIRKDGMTGAILDRTESIVSQGSSHYDRTEPLFLKAVPLSYKELQNSFDSCENMDVKVYLAMMSRLSPGTDGYCHGIGALLDGEYNFSDHPRRDGGQSSSDRLWDLGDALSSTSAIAGYHKVEARFPEGFGPKKIRKATTGKSFFVFFESNPIYTVSDSNGKSGTKLKTGHERRSHDRHDWLGAGIDRMKLSRDPAKRRQMVEDYHVRVTRVRQTWVGPKTFVVDGVTYTKCEDGKPLENKDG